MIFSPRYAVSRRSGRIPHRANLAPHRPCPPMGGLLDLLQNAAESRRTDAPVRVRVQTRSVDRYTDFSITGNGQAIAPSALPGIGKAFYTSRLSQGGSGLGLSVVQGIVGDHSGKLEGEALPDGDSHMRVLLPLA